MTQARFKSAVILLTGVAPWAIIWCGSQVLAQPPAPGTAEGFEATEYFQPENTRLKYRIAGAEAQLQSGGRYLIKQLKIETFRVTGGREVVVEAPECLYDSAKGQASSPGHLQVQSGDGRLSVAGEGFLWQQSQGNLTISNQVRSISVLLSLA